MTTPTERQFAIYQRGEVREIMLREMREGLRLLVDPETGASFTEDVIRRATARGSRFYRQAEAVDLVGMGHQKRDEFLAQQLRIDRSGSEFLRNFHGPFWGEGFLPAFGASGTVTATGLAGTIWTGSTTLGDPLAVKATDSAGNRYQVITSATAGAGGTASVVLVGIDGGDATNLLAGATVTWINPPSNSQPTATVAADFSGGVDAETDAEFAVRLASRVRHKPASGNWAHLRAEARAASTAVADAFIYSCALNAGTSLVVVTAKRGSATGPSARIPSLAVLAAVRSFLVPPASRVFPGRALVTVLPPVAEPSNMAVQLDMINSSTAGWTDAEPFPPINGTAAVTITTVTDQQDIEITASGAGLLPGGVSGPLSGVSLMVWNDATSEFEALDVTSVTDLGGGVYQVILGTAPSKTLAVGDFVSPATAVHPSIAEGVTAFFDSLGTGEVLDLATSELGARAFRNPRPSEEQSPRAGQTVLRFLEDALGSVLSDSALGAVSTSTPSVPSDPIDGPSLLVAGKIGVYPL